MKPISVGRFRTSARRFSDFVLTGENRIRFAPAYLFGILVVSLAWRLEGVPHDTVRVLCAYRPADLFDVTSLRIVGSAFLLPNATFWLGLVPLTLVLVALERRIGTLRIAAVTFVAHVLASVVGGVALRVVDADHSLHQLDVGSSVVMVSAATVLAAVSRSKMLGAIVLAATAIDAVTSFDLASFEHVVAVAVGLISAQFVHSSTPESAVATNTATEPFSRT